MNSRKHSFGKGSNHTGQFLRTKREALNLSQKELGAALTPPVTTQFISNLERGVTPIPVSHIHAITHILSVNEADLVILMEKDYADRITQKIGPENPLIHFPTTSTLVELPKEFTPRWKALIDSFRGSSASQKEAFFRSAESALNIHFEEDPLKKAV